jgi:hypothetical protein
MLIKLAGITPQVDLTAYERLTKLREGNEERKNAPFGKGGQE